MSESAFQTKVKAWLKDHGCYVLVVTVIAGIPEGCPDIVALCPSGRFVALEVKPSAKASFRPLQKPTIAKLNAMGYSKAVYPENWLETQAELLTII